MITNDNQLDALIERRVDQATMLGDKYRDSINDIILKHPEIGTDLHMFALSQVLAFLIRSMVKDLPRFNARVTEMEAALNMFLDAKQSLPGFCALSLLEALVVSLDVNAGRFTGLFLHKLHSETKDKPAVTEGGKWPVIK